MKFKYIIVAIAVLAIFKIDLFFTVSGMVGYAYRGIAHSPVYIIYLTAILGFSGCIYLFSLYNERSMSLSDWVGIGYPALMLLVHALLVASGAESEPLPKILQYFLVLSLPGIFSARFIHTYGLWESFIRCSEFAFLVLAFGVIVVLVYPFVVHDEMVRYIGGATYQFASYVSAFCFGGLAYFRLIANEHPDLRVRWPRFVNLLYWFLLPAMFVGALINGGRGAFLLMIVYMIGIAVVKIREANFHIRQTNLVKALIAVPLILGITYLIIKKSRILSYGLNRATAFIKWDSGPVLDFKGGSSGRDLIYAKVIESIRASPWFGYGPFGHWDRVVQPHNFFLDIFLQWGMVGGLALIAGLGWILWKCLNLTDPVLVFLVFLGLYPVVYLSFSGGYLSNAMFWFVILGIMSRGWTQTSVNN